ncbi:HD family phosphohydrolase [Chengkuizengella axinellae]|uniref:HDIG domain-containing protein n=1 Tax=Chengkuizengella axinellae TaxID=3064388 RepID=A0ABT9IUT2_9BACL|nr:HDIG domain-containing metalloprotein [Chengkuizengella sp. 2205SS18-9]MDP5273096.1 HDIG domain-containing protein [Chengkuizengella sp. 2205SS18-9]
MIFTKSSDKKQAFINGWKQSKLVRLFLYLTLVLVFFFSVFQHLIVPNNNSGVADNEKESIQDTPVYVQHSIHSLDFLDRIFDKLEQINIDASLTDEVKTEIYSVYFSQEYDAFVEDNVKLLMESEESEDSFNVSLIQEIEKQYIDQQYTFPVEAFFKLPRLSQAEVIKMRPVAESIVSNLMKEQIEDASVIRGKVAEMVNASNLSDDDSRILVTEIVRYSIFPNYFYDAVATQDAMSATDTAETNYWQIVGLSILVILFTAFLYMYIRQSKLQLHNNNVQLLMLVFIFIINILGMKIVALGQSLDYPYLGFLAPVAMGSMLIAILLDYKLAFISSILFSLLASIIFNFENPDVLFDYRYGLVASVISFTSIFAVHKASQRSSILKAGIFIALVECLSIASIFLLTDENNITTFVLSMTFALMNGLLTAVFVIGILPFFEVSFGILSSVKLVELSNPNHPMLRKLLTETPGTYHHSVMVANLSEAAAESIGANGLLCRVGSFYHDVGKTKRPNYFIENQINSENPHDTIDPDLSKSIIIAHARDGVEMLKEHKMPKPICDIAEQHHGTTLLKYFYHKAKKQQELSGEFEEEIQESDFRYPGPKAQFKEAAIVGLCDCVEAAVRSLSNPTMDQINTMVDKIIKDRLEDQQLNECDLTLKEIDTIAKTLKETLLGIFHSRIEYPELPSRDNDKKGVTKDEATVSM